MIEDVRRLFGCIFRFKMNMAPHLYFHYVHVTYHYTKYQFIAFCYYLYVLVYPTFEKPYLPSARRPYIIHSTWSLALPSSSNLVILG